MDEKKIIFWTIILALLFVGTFYGFKHFSGFFGTTISGVATTQVQKQPDPPTFSLLTGGGVTYTIAVDKNTQMSRNASDGSYWPAAAAVSKIPTIAEIVPGMQIRVVGEKTSDGVYEARTITLQGLKVSSPKPVLVH